MEYIAQHPLLISYVTQKSVGIKFYTSYRTIKHTYIIMNRITIKFFATLLIVILAGFSVTAQTTSIGPMLGTNITTLSNVPNAEHIGGLSIGGFLNHSVNENFGVNAKLLFSQFGTGYENSTFQTRLNYIQLPISGVYYFGQAGNRLRPKIYAGVYAAALTNGEADDVLSLGGQTKFEDFDAGGQIGLGFNYRIQSMTWLNVDLGYTGGLVNVSEFQGDNIRNKGVNLNIGLSFPIVK